MQDNWKTWGDEDGQIHIISDTVSSQNFLICTSYRSIDCGITPYVYQPLQLLFVVPSPKDRIDFVTSVCTCTIPLSRLS